MRVLVVEDESITRKMLAQRIARLGHEVTEAGNGLEAWRIYQQQEFPLVLCDWMMPELNGPDLCRRIRASKPRRYTYFILITALKGKSNYMAGIESGADDLLNKADDPDLLKARLHVAQRILALQNEVKQLQGLLPICQYCKHIRDEGNQWIPMENYISERSAADFSHGICPECEELYVRPQLEELKKQASRTGT